RLGAAAVAAAARRERRPARRGDAHRRRDGRHRHAAGGGPRRGDRIESAGRGRAPRRHGSRSCERQAPARGDVRRPRQSRCRTGPRELPGRRQFSVRGVAMTDAPELLRVLIVDDEEPARMAVRAALAGMDGIEVVGECANGFDAVKAAGELRPDVMLLDVQMPKLDGFEVLELIDRSVPVVFVTAYAEFALRAFEFNAGYFLC